MQRPDVHGTPLVVAELGVRYADDAGGSPVADFLPFFVKRHGESLLVAGLRGRGVDVLSVPLAGDPVTVIDHRSSGATPVAACDVDADGRIYLLSAIERSVGVYDQGGRLVERIGLDVPGIPIGLQVQADGSLLVGTWRPGGVHLVAPAAGDVTWSFTDSSEVVEARCVATIDDDVVAVADAGLHRILLLARDGRPLGSVGEAGNPGTGHGRLCHPSMVDVDAGGDLIVCDTRNHRVLRVQNGAVVREWPGPAVDPSWRLFMPWCARVDGADVIVADTYNNRVVRFGAEGSAEVVGRRTTSERCLSFPRSVERVDVGRYLVADTYNNRVVEMDCRGDVVWSYPSAGSPDVSPLFWPRCAVRRRDGATAILDSRNARIVDVSASGAVEIVVADLDDPHAFVVDPSDDSLLVVDTGHDRVIRMRPNGDVAWVFTGDGSVGPLRDPHHVSVTPAGQLVVSDTGRDRLVIIGSDGGARVIDAVTLDGKPSPLRQPRAAHLRWGHFFILDSGNSRLVVAREDGEAVWVAARGLPSPIPDVSSPRWLSVVSPRRVLVTDYFQGRVLVLELPRWWRGGPEAP